MRHDSPLPALFQAAVEAVKGAPAVQQQWQQTPIEEPFYLIAVGKAAQAMTEGVLELAEEQLIRGLVLSKYEHISAEFFHQPKLECWESAHPLPDQNSLVAGQKLVEFVEALPPGARVLALVSGGASALVEHLHEALALTHLQQLNQWLLSNGIEIGRMNQLRSRLSAIKRGGLLAHFDQARIDCWMISDVPGDAPVSIGSGLFVEAPLHADLADLPEAIRTLCQERPRLKANSEVNLQVIASNAIACEAAAHAAQAQGYAVQVSAELFEGDVKAVAERLAAEIEAFDHGVFIAGGEPTLHLPENPGQGGRNQHLALLMAQRFSVQAEVQILVAGTDGGDGPTPYAGAMIDQLTLSQLEASGWNVEHSLKACDSSSALAAVDCALETGPSGTNVMDLLLAYKP